MVAIDDYNANYETQQPTPWKNNNNNKKGERKKKKGIVQELCES